ncbi:MAG: hypothetical protein ABI528_09195, partial [bacterium]
MKKFLTAAFVMAALFLYSLLSYSQEMTIETYNTQEPPMGEYDARKAVSSYEVTNGADPIVYIKYELNGNGAWETHPLMILITKDDGTNVYSYPFDPGGSSGIYYATSTPIPAGNYTVKLVEGSDESSVWAKKDIKVGAALTKVGGSKNIIFCENVDDNWNPIGVVSSIKAGECINLMVELPQAVKNFRTVDWEIFKMNSDGTDAQYVTQLMM